MKGTLTQTPLVMISPSWEDFAPLNIPIHTPSWQPTEFPSQIFVSLRMYINS